MPTKHVIIGAVALIGLLGISAVPAQAQDAAKAEISGGYDYLRISVPGYDAEGIPKGWFAEVAGNVNRALAIVGAVGGSDKTPGQETAGSLLTPGEPASVHAFLGGVRGSYRGAGKVVPFGQILFGAGKLSAGQFSATKKRLDFGGGVNAWVQPQLGIRLGADYLKVFSKGEGENDTPDNVNVVRLTVGVVVALGGSR